MSHTHSHTHTGSYHLYRRTESTARYRQRSRRRRSRFRSATPPPTRTSHALRGGGTVLRYAPRANEPTDYVHLAALYMGYRKRGDAPSQAAHSRCTALSSITPHSTVRRRSSRRVRRQLSRDTWRSSFVRGESASRVS